MQLGIIGPGRLSANRPRRLARGGGHACVVFDPHSKKLQRPRAPWLEVPAGAVESMLQELAPLGGMGDVIIDGGNSYYHDDIRRAEQLAAVGGQEEKAS